MTGPARRLAAMFNLSGSELVFLLLLALIVLGPEKLPEAVRKFGRVYSELKKMSTGFQTELKTALDEPMREMRETADALKKAVNFEFDDEGGLVVSDEVNEPADVPEKVQKFDFDDEGGSVPRVDPPEQPQVSEAVEEPASE
jgi:Tat protein translocase TatB subunit